MLGAVEPAGTKLRQDELLGEIHALRQREANLRDFVETATIGLHWVSGDGTVLWANQAELDLLGYSSGEYIGRQIAEFHADQPVIADILASLIRGDTLREYPARLLCKDGSIRHVLINSSVLFEDGKFVHTRCFTRDVTAQKKAEEIFQEQARIDAFAARIGKHMGESGNLQEMLRHCTRTMVEHLDAAFARIWTLNEQGDVLELQASSGAYTHLDGAHARVPVGKFKIGRIAAERKPHLTNRVIGDASIPDQEWAAREGMIAFAGYPLIVENRLLGVMGMFSRHALSDVTLQAMARVADQIAVGIERKRVETALRESEARLHEVIEALPAAVYTTDAEGRIKMFNQAAVEFSGRVSELDSDSWCVTWKLYEPDGTPLPHDRCPMAIALKESRQVFGCEAVAERPDGTRRNFIPYPTPLFDASGKLTGAVNMLVDITGRKQAEETLRQREERLRAIFDSSVVGVAVLTPETRFVQVNEAFCSITGYSEAELLSMGSAELTHPGDRAHMLELMEQLISGSIPTFVIEKRYFRKDGATIWVQNSVSLTRDSKGRPANIVKLCQDVTERKQAEDALRKNQTQLQTLFNEAPIGIFLIDAQMRIRQVNPTATPLFGKIDNVLGRDFSEILHILWPRETAMRIVDRFRHTRDTGEPYRVPEFSEERYDRKEREYYDWQIHRIPLPDGRQGVVCYFSDISAHVKAREAVTESEERLRFMAESMPQKIFTAKPSGEVDYFNRQWTTFTGLSFDQIKDWGWKQFIHPEDVEENVRTWKHSLDTGEPFEFVHRFRRADGAYRWHLSRAHAMRDADGKISMWIGSNTDIHKEKQTEEELRRVNEDLNLFAFAASHDLQEPLRMITSYSQLLVREHRGALNEDAEKLVGYIGEGTKRMRELLSDLLAYTALSAEQEVSADLIDLNGVLRKVLENLKPAIRDSGASIRVNSLPRVRGAEVHFVQIFQNLIGNAIKYRGAAPPAINVSAGMLNGEWRFEISDNGMGIAPEYHEKIFGIFKRLHGKKIPGTGVGLAICKRVVERQGGRIWVESEAGQGAKFYFTLPAIPVGN